MRPNTLRSCSRTLVFCRTPLPPFLSVAHIVDKWLFLVSDRDLFTPQPFPTPGAQTRRRGDAVFVSSPSPQPWARASWPPRQPSLATPEKEGSQGSPVASLGRSQISLPLPMRTPSGLPIIAA